MATLRSLCLAALLAAPAAAAERRVDGSLAPPVVPAAALAPQALPGGAAVPGVPPLAALAPALAAEARLSAGAAAPTQLTAVMAAAPAPLAAPAPGLAPAAAARPEASGAASAAGPAAASSSADPNADVAAGRLQFDKAAPSLSLDDIVRAVASRPLRAGVFIQQEQEGSLLASDPRDSSGNVFKYYRPVEMREDLSAQVQEELSGLQKVGYTLRRALRLSGRKSDYAAWDAWPLTSKLSYLDKLERAVVAERGLTAAWNAKVSLLLTRAPGAPDFLTKNPHMEAPPAAYKDAVGARYLQPELVTDKDHPAATVNEALARTKMLIAETGHAGTQYHVFVKAAPEALRAQLPALQSALQLVNNALFAAAAQDSLQNVAHGSLQPWHAGRSARVAALLRDAAAQPHTPQAEDPDSEKHAFVGLRYWGMEEGRLVISFELRGANIPWKANKQSMARGMEEPVSPERDYAGAQRWLALLAAYAERLAEGGAPRAAEPPVTLDAGAADALVHARARELGMPPGAYYGVADFARKLTGGAAVPPGYLFPFAVEEPGSPALRALTDALLGQSARVRVLERAGEFEEQKRNVEYLFWSAYRDWARGYEAREQARLRQLAAKLGV